MVTHGDSHSCEFAGGDQLATLRLRVPAPDAIRLANLQRVVEAVIIDRTDLADRFGSYLPAFPLILSLGCAGWKEQVGVVSTTQCCWLP